MINTFGTDGPKDTSASSTKTNLTIEEYTSGSSGNQLLDRQTKTLEAMSAQNKLLKERIKAIEGVKKRAGSFKVGDRVKVWWRREGQHYLGVITNISANDRWIDVKYDDGEEEQGIEVGLVYPENAGDDKAQATAAASGGDVAQI